MLKQSALFLILPTALFLSASVYSQTVLDTNRQKDLSIAIYNENRALVKDTREVNLQAGFNNISFSNISANIIPESAILSGNDIQTKEQNFNYDLLTFDSLLKKAIGKTVTVEYINPKTGEKETNSAELLAYNDGQPILKINDKIEASYPGRIIFNSIPDNLISEPTLSLEIKSEKAGNQVVNLSYLTTGLSWAANYVAELNKNEDKMNLNGFITLSNNSGIPYKSASLQLIAGNVHLVNQFMAQRKLASPRMANGVYMEMASSDAMPTVDNLSDFYIYTLPLKTDLLSQQTKQVALLSNSDIDVQKSYVFDNNLLPHENELKNIKPTIFFSFDNKKENHLGIALPKGIIRLYKDQEKNGLLFIGEDRINHTANLETVKLEMGQSFDVFANAKRTEFTRLSKTAYEAAYEITFKNGGKKDIHITLYQNFPGNWKIVSQSIASTNETSNRVKWDLTVPAGSESLFTYKVQVKNE